MENFAHIFTLLAKHEGISLNLDILETGLINIIFLIGILIYTGKDFLGSILEERKASIVNSIQDAENRLNEAQKRLAEADKQLSQASSVVTEIQNETNITKKSLLTANVLQAKKDLKICFERAIVTFTSKERQIFIQVKQEIISVALEQTIARTQRIFSQKDRADALINKTITKLRGDLL